MPLLNLETLKINDMKTKTIYLTNTEDGRYILSDTKPEIIEDTDAEGYVRSNRTAYDPEQGWWVETDGDICEILGMSVKENDYIIIEVR